MVRFKYSCLIVSLSVFFFVFSVLEIGFIDSPVFTRSVNDSVEFCVSIISGRLQSGLTVSIELKVGSESQGKINPK